MIIYPVNEWGPEVTIEEEETETYKQILDTIHSRRVKILRMDDDNSEIIHNIEKK